jgi:tRNA1(Val) A37 N6-methylase TrmN6
LEYLPNGLTLTLCDGAFPLSTDSMLLSYFVRLPKQASVLDLGSGCGTLGLLLCSKDANCRITGVELDANAHQEALENIRRNRLTSRMESICADLRSVSDRFSAGSFSCCVSNPPYFSAGPQSKTHPVARHEEMCTLEDLFRSAAWALRYGGDFFLVHKPDRLAELCACAAGHKLEPKRLLLLRHRPGDPIALIFLQCRKGAKPGLIWEDMYLHESDGSPSAAYRTLYNL